MIRSCGPPDNTTPGNVGDIYQDINTGRIYRCKDVKVHQNDHGYVTVSDYCPKNEYVWDDMSNYYDKGYADSEAYLGCNVILNYIKTHKSSIGHVIYERLGYNTFRDCTSNSMNGAFIGSKIQRVPEWDLRNAESMYQTFKDCVGLVTVSDMDINNARNIKEMFRDCTSLQTVGNITAHNTETCEGMFRGCGRLGTVGYLDMPKTTSVCYMFSSCTLDVDVEYIYCPEATDASYMFYNSTYKTDASNMTLGKLTTTERMFSGCSYLTKLPNLNMRNVTCMSYMFYNCASLKEIPEMDVASATYFTSPFYGCVALTTLKMKNIAADLMVGSGTSYGHLLTVDSLLGLIYELRNTGSSKTLTIGSANLEKISSMYVRTIPVTDDMLAEDEFINEKNPFELCESTDEGATLITDYIASKLWELA